MLNLRKALEQDILDGLVAAGYKLPHGQVVPVTRSEKKGHGDYASSVALMLAKDGDEKPHDIVGAIAEHMPKKEYIGKLEAAGPGFLNITISHDWLTSKVDNIATSLVCGDVNIGEGKLVNLEFISANPTGPLTLGNARTAFSADTLAKVLECAGYNVTREYYINDAGAQVARLGESVLRRALQTQGQEVEFPDTLYQGEYIQDLAKEMIELWKENEGHEFTNADLEDQELLAKVSTEAMEKMLAAIKTIVHDELKIHMDVWTSERALRKSTKVEKVVATLKEKELTYEKDGAVYIKTTQWGDEEDRVLIKNNGEYAYIAPDIAYHQDKFDREFDYIFTFLGADHQGHIAKLKGVMQALGNDSSKLHFPVAQWLKILREGKEVKLSKRKGEVYSPKDLIEEIGYDAARFFLVQHALSSHMTLDLTLAKERSERNPVYYIQYAYVRLQSILRKAKQQGVLEQVGEAIPKPSRMTLGEGAETDLIKSLFGLPEAIADIADSFDVHRLAYFAYDLARDIHGFYRDVHVLTEDKDRDVLLSRLHVVAAAKQVLGETLDLLGISKPDVM